jgi:preprotein translocase subunit YajC
MVVCVALFWQSEGPSFLFSIAPLFLIAFTYYFLIAKPQRERQQAHDGMLNQLKVGDKIITSGGIYGTITEINSKEGIVQLRIADNTKINIARSAIASLQNKDNTGSKETKES